MSVNNFDWEFYVSAYKDLRDAKINTRKKAFDHWRKYGMKEGRISSRSKFKFELYIRELGDDTIDTVEKAIRHYKTSGNPIYDEKMKLIERLRIHDINYYYELNDFIRAYKDYCFEGKSETEILIDVEQNDQIGFRYFCFRYINYMRNFRVCDLAVDSKREAVLIEFRKFPHVEFLIRNTIQKLPKDWSHTIICGRENYEFIMDMCKNISDKIKVKGCGFDKVPISEYSLLLGDLSGEKILVYREDSCILKSNVGDDQCDSAFGGGHEFWRVKNWKEHLYKYVCVQVCYHNKLIDTLPYFLHCGGWKWVINKMLKADIFNVNSNINFIDVAEHYIIDDNNNMIIPKFVNENNKFIAIIHGTCIGRSQNDTCCLKNVLDERNKFIANIKNCMCVFTFSEYAKKYISDIFVDKGIDVPINVFKHPTGFNTLIKFDWEKFINNDDLKIIQIGQQLRYFSTIYRLRTKLKKMWLPGNVDKKWAIKSLKSELKEFNITDKIDFASVSISYYEDYNEYNKLLGNNIVLVHLRDANANNSVIECIARNNPLIVNKHPAVVEYLGENYPLYFNEIGDIQNLLDKEEIRKGYEYLLNLDKSKLGFDIFADNIVQNICGKID
ncbi:MAG: putative WcaK-like polysaccharide pyruvyl transferase [Hyperionvirus sp.]|uniref:Putative WcaK-like polysaccharide pyruvyl transferase n=1 Tax=Hyperionvirus sp. TaxID=2487770 RepID=A0A3G5ABH8_9VIRU|nr:MAG: putative WcaK-like polysaccharide pyruvyl transferase [Hyperionvirus sp.]